jgi:hypothetical protein
LSGSTEKENKFAGSVAELRKVVDAEMKSDREHFDKG